MPVAGWVVGAACMLTPRDSIEDGAPRRSWAVKSAVFASTVTDFLRVLAEADEYNEVIDAFAAKLRRTQLWMPPT